MNSEPTWWDPFFGMGNNPHDYGKRSNSETDAAEEWVRQQIEPAWNCELYKFSKYSAIDFYAVRNGELVGLLEIKPRLWLNVRKWLALTIGSVGLGVPSYFFALKDGKILWIPVSFIHAHRVKITGERSITHSRGDIEPVIEIDQSEMRQL